MIGSPNGSQYNSNKSFVNKKKLTFFSIFSSENFNCRYLKTPKKNIRHYAKTATIYDTELSLDVSFKCCYFRFDLNWVLRIMLRLRRAHNTPHCLPAVSLAVLLMKPFFTKLLVAMGAAEALRVVRLVHRRHALLWKRRKKCHFYCHGIFILGWHGNGIWIM